MSKALETAIERCSAGTRLEVVESTYRPGINGTIRTIQKVAPLSRRLFTCDSSDQPGRPFAMELPRHNLEWIDDDTIRYPIGRKMADGTPHTVTLRFL